MQRGTRQLQFTYIYSALKPYLYSALKPYIYLPLVMFTIYSCNDTKVGRETGLMASVPTLKKSLEKFVYQVKVARYSHIGRISLSSMILLPLSISVTLNTRTCLERGSLRRCW